MKRAIGLGALAGLCAVVAASPALAGAPANGLVTLDGVSGAVPGMRPAQVADAIGAPVKLLGPSADVCRVAMISAGPLRGYAIFENRRLGALFFEKGARTGKGIRIGSTVADLEKAYGKRLRSQPDKYVPGARNVFVRRAKAPHWELRFDVSKAGKVTTIAQGAQQVRYVEACS
jgi:hypothetical protein